MNKQCQSLYYIDIFGLFEGDDARAITIHREQYGGTVHLFIGKSIASYVITFMPSTIANRVYKCHKDNIVICTQQLEQHLLPALPSSFIVMKLA
jgi:hypothetical protein